MKRGAGPYVIVRNVRYGWQSFPDIHERLLMAEREVALAHPWGYATPAYRDLNPRTLAGQRFSSALKAVTHPIHT